MSIYISTGTIKVGLPGIDAETAGEKDLVLSIGQRTGQLLQTGIFSLAINSETGGASGSASIGPFDRTPELIGYARNVGGYSHYPSCMVFDTQAWPGLPQMVETFVCSTMSLDSNGISVTGFARAGEGAPQVNAFAYIIYRKPNRG